MGKMTRAVIELPGDISPYMPLLSQHIEGCAYNREGNLMSFRFREMSVVVKPESVTAYRHSPIDEGEMRQMIDRFQDIIDSDSMRITF
jgi:ArsR family metal-binding transcriptional regulator